MRGYVFVCAKKGGDLQNKDENKVDKYQEQNDTSWK